MKDYYSILKIVRSASSIEIKTAYRNLSKQFHPDVNKAPNASAIFIEIKEAYEVLIDETRRIHYNQLLDYASHQQNQQIYNTPKISVFYCDNAEFSVGDVVTFTWEVFDADVVELRPFGKVTNAGTKKIRITDVSANLLVELFCFNSVSKNYVFSQMILQKRDNYQNANFKSPPNEFYYENIQDEKLTYFQNLIRNNPHINPKHFEKEKFNGIYGRIDAVTYTQRALVLTAIYLVLMYVFLSSIFTYPFILIFVNIAYYLSLYKQSVKRFHDFNSKGKFAFLSLIPLISWFQCVYLSSKEGNSEMNDFGLPSGDLKPDIKENLKAKIEKKINTFSTLTKVAISSALFNILVIFVLFLIPKQETPVQVIDIYSKAIKSSRSYQPHYFVNTTEGEFEISEQISKLFLEYKPNFLYLGKNPITDNVSFVRIRAGGEDITHYVSIIDFNSPIPVLYFLFLLFEIYVIIVDKKMKYEEQYDTILGFITMVNIAYFIFFIL